MQTSSERRLRSWLHRLPRWLISGASLGLLSGLTLLVAHLTDNWPIAPTAVVVGAMVGPVSLSAWLTDRTHIGRSVAPDVLFMVGVVGGGFAVVVAGVIQIDVFSHPTVGGQVGVA